VTICPIAIVAGCQKCPAFRICPAKTLLGDMPKAPPAAAAEVAPKSKPKAKPKAKPKTAAKPRAPRKPAAR
jgi:hypothetical protein